MFGGNAVGVTLDSSLSLFVVFAIDGKFTSKSLVAVSSDVKLVTDKRRRQTAMHVLTERGKALDSINQNTPLQKKTIP